MMSEIGFQTFSVCKLLKAAGFRQGLREKCLDSSLGNK